VSKKWGPCQSGTRIEEKSKKVALTHRAFAGTVEEKITEILAKAGFRG